MGKYYRTPSASIPDGTFRCYNCHRKLARIRGSDYILELNCPRCKARIVVTLSQPLPRAQPCESTGNDSKTVTQESIGRPA